MKNQRERRRNERKYSKTERVWEQSLNTWTQERILLIKSLKDHPAKRFLNQMSQRHWEGNI